MTKQIETLVPDIYDMLTGVVTGTTVEISDEELADLGYKIATHVKNTMTARQGGVRKGVLRVSGIGKPCKRQLWYEYNLPEHKEVLPPNTLIKFMYGNIIEEILLFLAKKSGHSVTHEQERVQADTGVDGWELKGSMDAVIDGTTIDVKSASSFAFKKFQDRTLAQNDAFGYMAQIVAYDALREQHDGGLPGILAMDKQTGSLTYMPLTTTEYDDAYADGVANTEMIARQMDCDLPPIQHFDPVPEGKSGNMKLPVNCSYCSFKEECWKNSNDGNGLRTFLYSNKPVFLTKVERVPKVHEVTKT